MPRAGLNKELVIESACRLANEHGLPALSLKLLADTWGIKTPSLYKHIKSLDELYTEMACRGYTLLSEQAAAAVEKRQGKAAARAMCRAYRDFALSSPGLYQTMLPSLENRDERLQAAGRPLMITVITVLEGLGVKKANHIHAARMLRSALHGYVDLELKGGFGLPEKIDVSFDYMLDRLLKSLAGK